MAPTHEARRTLGVAVRNERKSRTMSVETAATQGGIGHMTWRKIERGGSVHDQSYYAVDRAFGWQLGHTIATANGGGENLTPAPASDDTDPGEASAAEDKALAAPALARYLAALRERMDRDDRTTGTAWYTASDGQLHTLHDSTAYIFHEEYYLALDLLESLNVSEVRGLEHACSRLANETQQKLNAIHVELYSGSEWKPGETAEALHAEAQPEFNAAYSRYMETYARLMEMRVRMYELSNQPIGKINNLDALHRTAQELRERLDAAISELELIRARHTQSNTETEQQ